MIKTILTYDAHGKSKAVLTYLVRVVVNRGADLTSGKNHVDHVNAKGKYDIIEFLTDHNEDFKYLYSFSVGKLALHITTEVNC